MPPIEVYEIKEGERVDVTPRDEPSGGVSSGDDQARNGTGSQGATLASPAGEPVPSDSPSETPSPSPGEGEGDQEEPDAPDDAQVNAGYINRRIQRLTAARRKAERERDAATQQHQVELAQTKGQLEALTRMLQGAAPQLPDTPPVPTGPPQAQQYASHEDYVLAAARYGAQQELQARDQQTAQQRQAQQQAAFQQQLVEREQAYATAHPDYHDRVRSGLAGKVSPVLQQALMLVPDGPAVAYALAGQPELVQRLNTLPPPLVLVELGRLSPPPQTNGTAPTVPTPARGGTAPPALPAPPTPLSGAGGGAPTGTYSDSMSQEEYRAWRKRTSALPVWKDR